MDSAESPKFVESHNPCLMWDGERVAVYNCGLSLQLMKVNVTGAVYYRDAVDAAARGATEGGLLVVQCQIRRPQNLVCGMSVKIQIQTWN